jgi:hypothetical protein
LWLDADVGVAKGASIAARMAGSSVSTKRAGNAGTSTARPAKMSPRNYCNFATARDMQLPVYLSNRVARCIVLVIWRGVNREDSEAFGPGRSLGYVAGTP